MTALFIVPVMFIVFISYKDVGSSFNATNWDNQTQDYDRTPGTSDVHWGALLRFGDWFIMMMMRSDMGVWGFLLSLMIHV